MLKITEPSLQRNGPQEGNKRNVLSIRRPLERVKERLRIDDSQGLASHTPTGFHQALPLGRDSGQRPTNDECLSLSV
jgi:hypothetical protein